MRCPSWRSRMTSRRKALRSCVKQMRECHRILSTTRNCRLTHSRRSLSHRHRSNSSRHSLPLVRPEQQLPLTRVLLRRGTHSHQFPKWLYFCRNSSHFRSGSSRTSAWCKQQLVCRLLLAASSKLTRRPKWRSWISTDLLNLMLRFFICKLKSKISRGKLRNWRNRLQVCRLRHQLQVPRVVLRVR